MPALHVATRALLVPHSRAFAGDSAQAGQNRLLPEPRWRPPLTPLLQNSSTAVALSQEELDKELEKMLVRRRLWAACRCGRCALASPRHLAAADALAGQHEHDGRQAQGCDEQVRHREGADAGAVPPDQQAGRAGAAMPRRCRCSAPQQKDEAPAWYVEKLNNRKSTIDDVLKTLVSLRVCCANKDLGLVGRAAALHSSTPQLDIELWRRRRARIAAQSAGELLRGVGRRVCAQWTDRRRPAISENVQHEAIKCIKAFMDNRVCGATTTQHADVRSLD